MSDSLSNPIKDQDINHILLWMPNWIGDVVLTFPTLRSLRKRFPGVRMTVVTRSPSDELLIAHPAVDSVIKIPFGPGTGWLSHIKFSRGLKKYNFDLAVVFPNSLRSALMVFLSGAKIRLGYNTEGRELFLTHPIPVTSHEKRAKNRVDYFFEILEPLGLEAPEQMLEPLVRGEGDRTVEEILLGMGLGKDEPLIAVHPGTSKPERAWHGERFGILCQKLIKLYSLKIILLGTPGEADLLVQVRRMCPPDMIFTVPVMHLRDIATLLKTCRMFIGNDSGLMHLAALVGTPTVAIFGPGHPDTSGPFLDSEKMELVTKNYSCSPCRQRFFKECKPSPHHKPYCLEDISVKDVSDAVDQLAGRFPLR